jgi:hypothetical protein
MNDSNWMEIQDCRWCREMYERDERAERAAKRQRDEAALVAEVEAYLRSVS